VFALRSLNVCGYPPVPRVPSKTPSTRTQRLKDAAATCGYDLIARAGKIQELAGNWADVLARTLSVWANRLKQGSARSGSGFRHGALLALAM